MCNETYIARRGYGIGLMLISTPEKGGNLFDFSQIECPWSRQNFKEQQLGNNWTQKISVLTKSHFRQLFHQQKMCKILNNHVESTKGQNSVPNCLKEPINIRKGNALPPETEICDPKYVYKHHGRVSDALLRSLSLKIGDRNK